MDDKLFLMFMSIYGWQFHPKNPPENRMTPQECLDEALKALIVFGQFIDGGD